VYYADLAADRARFFVRDVYNFYVAPNIQRPKFNPDNMPFDLKVHPHRGDKMFYI
jgi:hypothetical protein